jgi:hypothetical protein
VPPWQAGYRYIRDDENRDVDDPVGSRRVSPGARRRLPTASGRPLDLVQLRLGRLDREPGVADEVVEIRSEAPMLQRVSSSSARSGVRARSSGDGPTSLTPVRVGGNERSGTNGRDDDAIGTLISSHLTS